MNGTHILDLYRTQLADQILAQSADIPDFNPMDISPWLAMSLMQKAIRRNRLDLALRSAATLLKNSPERLWRRLTREGDGVYHGSIPRAQTSRTSQCLHRPGDCLLFHEGEVLHETSAHAQPFD